MLQVALKSREIENEEELQVLISRLSVSIQRLKALIDGTEPPPEEPEVSLVARYIN